VWTAPNSFRRFESSGSSHRFLTPSLGYFAIVQHVWKRDFLLQNYWDLRQAKQRKLLSVNTLPLYGYCKTTRVLRIEYATSFAKRCWMQCECKLWKNEWRESGQRAFYPTAERKSGVFFDHRCLGVRAIHPADYIRNKAKGSSPTMKKITQGNSNGHTISGGNQSCRVTSHSQRIWWAIIEAQRPKNTPRKNSRRTRRPAALDPRPRLQRGAVMADQQLPEDTHTLIGAIAKSALAAVPVVGGSLATAWSEWDSSRRFSRIEGVMNDIASQLTFLSNCGHFIGCHESPAWRGSH